MCEHKRIEIETYSNKEGFATGKCLDCGEPITTIKDSDEKIPYGIKELMKYGKRHKNIKPVTNPNKLDEYVSPIYPKIERTRF